jgi:hypothetical protein
MADRGILESDIQGRYRIRPVRNKKLVKQWVAPNIAQILKESGVAVESNGDRDIADDDYYEHL